MVRPVFPVPTQNQKQGNPKLNGGFSKIPSNTKFLKNFVNNALQSRPQTIPNIGFYKKINGRANCSLFTHFLKKPGKFSSN